MGLEILVKSPLLAFHNGVIIAEAVLGYFIARTREELFKDALKQFPIKSISDLINIVL